MSIKELKNVMELSQEMSASIVAGRKNVIRKGQMTIITSHKSKSGFAPHDETLAGNGGFNDVWCPTVALK